MRHPGADHGRSGPHLSCREAALSQYSTIKYTCISSLFCPFLRPLVLPIIPRSELARAHFLQRKAEFTRSHPSSPTLMFEESRSTRERKRDLSIQCNVSIEAKNRSEKGGIFCRFCNSAVDRECQLNAALLPQFRRGKQHMPDGRWQRFSRVIPQFISGSERGPLTSSLHLGPSKYDVHSIFIL